MTGLTYFRDEDLLSLARNPAAQARHDAIRLLLERNSTLASHPDIAAEAAALIHSQPRVLKKIKPSSNFGSVLPGVVDVMERTIDRTGQLESRAVAIEATAQEHARTLAATADKLRAQIGDTNNCLGDLEDALCDYLRDLDYRHELTRLALGQLSARFESTVEKHELRLARLERSPLRKLYDWAIVPFVGRMARLWMRMVIACGRPRNGQLG